MIHLYDGNNVMRRAMERSTSVVTQPMSLRMRYEEACAATPGSQIWCWDGYSHNERRRDIYPKYKTNRTPTPEDIFAQIKFWRSLLKHSPATQIDVHGWEADDIIATLTRRFVKQGLPVTIHSNDMDYAQLEHLPGVILNGVNTKDVPGRWVPLFKAMNGDKSDNIDGIHNFGIKRWQQMEEHWPQIERAIVAGDPAGFVGLPFTKGVAEWLQMPGNVELLQSMLLVTHFFEVPDDELNGGIIEGKLNREEAHAMLKRYFL